MGYGYFDAIRGWHLYSPQRVGRRGHGHAAEAELVIRMLHAVCDDAGLANALNRNGVRCGSEAWTADSVRRFRDGHGIAPFDAEQKQAQGLLTGEEAALASGISTMSVHRLVQKGIIAAEQPAPGFPLVIRQSDLSRAEVQESVRRIQLSLPRPLPADPNQLKLFLTPRIPRKTLPRQNLWVVFAQNAVKVTGFTVFCRVLGAGGIEFRILGSVSSITLHIPGARIT